MINDYTTKHFDCSLEDLEHCNQYDLVKFFAEQHNISTIHGYLVKRQGQEALENPLRFLGDQYGPTVLRFWCHLDNLTPEDHDRIGSAWIAARGAAWDAAWIAAWDARDAARDTARDTARDAAWYAAWDARDAARGSARDAARGATWDSAWGAINEIYGQDVMRSKDQEFYFCKMVGFDINKRNTI